MKENVNYCNLNKKTYPIQIVRSVSIDNAIYIQRNTSNSLI